MFIDQNHTQWGFYFYQQGLLALMIYLLILHFKQIKLASRNYSRVSFAYNTTKKLKYLKSIIIKSYKKPDKGKKRQIRNKKISISSFQITISLQHNLIVQRMPPSKRQQQQLPMLLFLLQHKKYHELIKSMYNEKMAGRFLTEYGYEGDKLTKENWFIIGQNAANFTIEDLIEIKGSYDKKVKRFENTLLIQTILKKLRSNYIVETLQRKMFWLQFTDIYIQQSLYEGLDALQLPPDTDHILEKDIKRTYYNLPTKNSQQKEKQTEMLRASLKQSLGRFALYNPYLLYCQGMNEVFGFLYEEKFSAKESFFIFKRITETILPCDYYSSLQGIVSYLKVLWEMISVSYPKIHHKLNSLIREMDFSGSYLCVFSHVLQWFVCLFTNTMLNRNIRKIIMDYFLLQGITVFFKASLAIFQYLEETILKVKSFQSYVMRVEQAVRNYDNVQHLRKFLNEKYISKQILFLMKQYAANPQQLSQKRNLPFVKKCYKKWNFCLQQLQNNFHSQHKYDFFVYKGKQNVKLIPDYLQKLNTFYFDKSKNLKPVEMLKIGRIPHVCQNHSEEGTQDSLSEKSNLKRSGLVHTNSPGSMVSSRVEVNNNEASTSSTTKRYMQSAYINQKNQPIPQQFTTVDNQPLHHSKLSQSYIALQDQQSVYHRKQTLQYRQMIKQKLLQQTQKKTLQKSESMMFMKMMVDNESYSNLFSLLGNEEMDRMFDIGSESEGEEERSGKRG